MYDIIRIRAYDFLFYDQVQLFHRFAHDFEDTMLSCTINLYCNCFCNHPTYVLFYYYFFLCVFLVFTISCTFMYIYILYKFKKKKEK